MYKVKTGISNACMGGCNTLRTNTDTPHLPSHIKEAIGIKLNIKACQHLKFAAGLLYVVHCHAQQLL